MIGYKIRTPDARQGGTHGGTDTTHVPAYAISSREIGQINIYMTHADKASTHGMKRWFSKPLYRAVIEAAKKEGILNANAHHAHHGYSALGDIQSNDMEIPNDKLTLCIELISSREKLEQFCRGHGHLLTNKIVVYKRLEHWDVAKETGVDIQQE